MATVLRKPVEVGVRPRPDAFLKGPMGGVSVQA